MSGGFEATTTGQGLTLRLRGGIELVDRAVEELRGFLLGKGLEGALFDVELLAREALLNALGKGAPLSASGEVRVELTLPPGEVRLRVEDDGPGFDWRGQLERTPPDPGSETGRGLFIMKSYADGVEFNPRGNSVLLTKRVSTEERDMNQTGEAKTVAMPEKVSAQEMPALREEFKKLVREGVRELTLDFGQVRSIDSVGIGLLVAAHNTLAKVQGVLKVVNVGPEIHQLLTLMRLDKHFSVARAATRAGEGA